LLVAVSTHLTMMVFVVRTRLGDAPKGATAVEYGLLVALIAAVLITVVTLLGTNLSAVFTKVATKIH